MKSLVFCEHCGKPMHQSTLHDAKKLWYCSCGFLKEHSQQVGIAEKIKQKEIGSGVIIDKIEKGGFPHICRKCGYNECDIETLSAFYSDESDISLYRCRKCGHTERETDGTSNAF